MTWTSSTQGKGKLQMHTCERQLSIVALRTSAPLTTTAAASCSIAFSFGGCLRLLLRLCFRDFRPLHRIITCTPK